jgi:hypothetical protein
LKRRSTYSGIARNNALTTAAELPAAYQIGQAADGDERHIVRIGHVRHGGTFHV